MFSCFSAPWWFWSSLVRLTLHNLHLQFHSQASWGHLYILRKIFLETMVSRGPLWVPLFFKSLCVHRVCQLCRCLHHFPVSFGRIFYQLLDEGYSCPNNFCDPCCPFGGFMSLDFLAQETWIWDNWLEHHTFHCSYLHSSTKMLFSLTCPSLHEPTGMQCQQEGRRNGVRISWSGMSSAPSPSNQLRH